jgi:formylglycine-generating enzyme required for sulfatase activity
MGVYEVTQAEYERVMGENPSYFRGGARGRTEVRELDTSRFPTDQISWTDAVEFCRKLSAVPAEKAAGREYRLPTEAEWEYACRAGTTTTFYTGADLDGRVASCFGKYPEGTQAGIPHRRQPSIVGSFAPNAFGLFDMSGNIWEWCQDVWADDYYKNSPEDDPQGPRRREHWDIRVLRGGCWQYHAEYCRSACRHKLPEASRHFFLGFRVVAVSPEMQTAKGEKADE